MWLVSNNNNLQILQKYNLIIISLFELLIELSTMPTIEEEMEVVDFLENKFANKENLDRRLLNVNISRTDKFKPLIKEIILLGTDTLSEEYEKFNLQNSEILKVNYNIIPLLHPIQLTKLFKDYFYSLFFGVDWIWRDLVGEVYTRKMFKENFKKENKLSVCSYCDIDTISNDRNAWIEHFLPKSIFPYLSCNPMNLIPSCTSCNVSGSGKGVMYKNPIANQYNMQIGEKIDFELVGQTIKINDNANVSVENYIELLNLRTRYSDELISQDVLTTLKISYNLFLNAKNIDEFDKNIFFDYLQDMGRINGFYFVQKGLLNSIDRII